eukprot:752195-Hanusia_phi.AAC.3
MQRYGNRSVTTDGVSHEGAAPSSATCMAGGGVPRSTLAALRCLAALSFSSTSPPPRSETWSRDLLLQVRYLYRLQSCHGISLVPTAASSTSSLLPCVRNLHAVQRIFAQSDADLAFSLRSFIQVEPFQTSKHRPRRAGAQRSPASFPPVLEANFYARSSQYLTSVV